MSYLWYFGCLINRHAPIRRHVEWDGLTYRGKCRYCGAAITRKTKGVWRKREDSLPADSDD